MCIFGFAHNRKFQSSGEIESAHEFEFSVIYVLGDIR